MSRGEAVPDFDRLGWRLLAGDDLALVHNHQAPVQPLLDLYPALGIA